MDEFMEASLEEARCGLAEGRIPIGAVLVRNGKTIGRPQPSQTTGSAILHAEMDTLENAGTH